MTMDPSKSYVERCSGGDVDEVALTCAFLEERMEESGVLQKNFLSGALAFAVINFCEAFGLTKEQGAEVNNELVAQLLHRIQVKAGQRPLVKGGGEG